MEKLRLRCPTCSKLYEVSDADITSASPQFDCISCATRFSFDYPVVNPRDVQTRALSAPTGLTFHQTLEAQNYAALQQELESSSEKTGTHSCPKCGAVNDNKLAECYACHVIFARLAELPLDPSLRAQPSLVRKWKNLVVHFDSLSLHEDFLKSCHELEALRFAILKYEELQSAQGGKDEVCESMIYKAHGLLQVTLYGKRTGDLRFKKDQPKPVVPWHKYVFFTPLMISFLVMMTGFFSVSQRNLVGAGVAMMLLTFGLTLFWKGRISLADFIN
jgi:hypothetical protein